MVGREMEMAGQRKSYKRSFLSKLECGRANADMRLGEVIAKLLKCSMEDLLREEME